MGHTIFATRIFGHAIDDAVTIPINVCQHFSVGRVMAFAIGQEIARRFPAHYVSGRDGPSGTGQIPVTGEKFPIDWGSEEAEAFAPGFGFRKFLDPTSPGHKAGRTIVTNTFVHFFFSPSL